MHMEKKKMKRKRNKWVDNRWLWQSENELQNENARMRV